MPTHKLSEQCEKDVDRYVDLRFSHWSEFDRAKRKRDTKEALKNLGPDEQESYSRQVEAMFQKNADFLESCDREKDKLVQRQKLTIRKAVQEGLRGNHDKQH